MEQIMWSDAFDLHSHSTNSDGEHSVDFVAKLMAEAGVKHWALTDHDTIAGWDDAKLAAQQVGIEFIPGLRSHANQGLRFVNTKCSVGNEIGLQRLGTCWRTSPPQPLLNSNKKNSVSG